MTQENAEKKKPKIIEYLETVAPILPAPIYWEDVNSVILGGNEPVFKATGALVPDAYVGKTLYELYPIDMATHIKKHNEEVMSTGKILSQEEAIEDITTGEFKYFTAVKGPLRDEDGKIIGIVGTSVEITDRKRAEEQLKIEKEKAETALKVKSDFLAVVSHELRTPLTGILGMVEILQTEKIPEEEREEYLRNIDTASKHLLAIINNILDFAKLNENKFSLVNIPFDLVDTFEKTLDILEAKALEKNITLDIHYPQALPRYFLGDPKALLQIFINVIGNAIKFTDRGGVVVHTEKRQADNNRVVFAIIVKDTGIGIPADKLERIFERFEQVNSSVVRAYGGTGLGLSVTQKLVELMGGMISVESEVGKGSVFTILLPLELDLQRMSATQMQEQKKNEIIFKKDTRVLLVEDDALIQLVHKHKFEKLGCKFVDIAKNGTEALACYAENHYDIAFVDIGLPDMTGNEVIQKIRALEGNDKRLCIVALTAYSDEENRRRIRESGADTVLSKPIEEPKLLKVLAKYL
ncbi:MAG: Sensory box histidine kinase/response regulator [Gammaproteobacteria bacterium]|jgi:signal transduction histidine kinase/ActR/RegA family two-component response regulator|nr:Sensory box histidine kinase/response regulator [Gammaproteobacteria bacterium]